MPVIGERKALDIHGLRAEMSFFSPVEYMM